MDTFPELKDEIDKVSSRRVWTHGPFSQKTWVGHRVIFLKNAKPWGDHKFRVVHKSPIVKERANDTQVAFFGGSHYRTPETNKSEYRVQHVFIYYKKGSKTKVIGRVQGLVEVYRLKHLYYVDGTSGTEGGPAGRLLQLHRLRLPGQAWQVVDRPVDHLLRFPATIVRLPTGTAIAGALLRRPRPLTVDQPDTATPDARQSGPTPALGSQARHHRLAGQAARLRLPLVGDLRRHQRGLGLRTPGRGAQEQRQAGLVALDGAGA